MTMEPNDKQLANLARIVGATEQQEISCDEMLDRVAAYVQALTDRAELSDHLRAVAQHLKICPECCEELKLLLKAEGIDPKTILDE